MRGRYGGRKKTALTSAKIYGTTDPKSKEKKRKQSKIKTLTEAEFASLEIVRDCIDEVVDEVEVK